MLTDEQVARWHQDRMAFRREAILLEDGEPFGPRVELWQEEDFRALDGGQYRHAYLGRPRGHSKTGDVGTEAVTEMVLGEPGELYCAAADEDQARLLFNDVAGKFLRSPDLRKSAHIYRSVIEVPATQTVFKVLAADAPSAYGLRPRWIAADEVAQWKKRDLWDALWSATGKRKNCRVLVITTAGWDFGHVAWEIYKLAQSEENWYFADRGRCASWIDPSWLAQQKRTLPNHVFARLHENRWVPGSGAFLTEEEVEAVFGGVPDGPGTVAIGVDLGVARDRSVLATCKKLDDGTVSVLHLETWIPERDKVRLEDVEAAIVGAVQRYPTAQVRLDPWQAMFMQQRLQARGIRADAYAFTTENRRLLFGAVLDLVRAGQLKCRPHDALRGELLNLETQETAAGWRVDHRPGKHDDHVVAIGLAATVLKEYGMGVEGRTAMGPERVTASIPW